MVNAASGKSEEDSAESGKLNLSDIRHRAKKIKLVLTDCDGVLTDTGVYYSDKGEVMKRFSIRDGMGTELLRNEEIETGIITGELSGSVKTRAKKLKIRHLYLGVKNKRKKVDEILKKTNLKANEIAYIGDDVNDLAIIEFVNLLGLTAAPNDAIKSVREKVHFVCSIDGGKGAFREFADWILDNRK